MKSIRKQLIFSLVAGVTLLEVCAGGGLFAYVEEALEHSLDAALSAKADAIMAAVHMEDDGHAHFQSSGGDPIKSAHHEGPFYFQLWRADGSSVFRGGPPDTTAALPRLDGRHRRFADVDVPGVGSSRATQVQFVAQPDADEFDAQHARSNLPGETLTLVVTHHNSAINETLAVLMTGMVVTALVMTAGIVGIVTWNVRRGLRPLNALANQVEQFGPANLQLRCDTASLPAEIQPVAEKLNDLLDRLQQGFERERRFSANIAHELRTPLAELRTACEVALRWPENNSSADAVRESLAISRQMEGTVQALLSLVRLQAGTERAAVQSVDLHVALTDAWRPLESEAIVKQLNIVQPAEPGRLVRADPHMLTQVLRNLLGNAVQHSPVGGKIRIETRPSQSHTTLSVGNTNQSLDAADVPHLLEPFWRKDSARTDHTSIGLGLTLVQEYCCAIGAHLTVRLMRPDWFEATVTFCQADDVEPTSEPADRGVQPLLKTT